MRALIRISRLPLGMAILMLAACSSGVEDGGGQSRFEVGETIYRQYCFSCHSSGINGAPRVGDNEAWTRLVEENGEADLLRTTKEGVMPYMPKMGLCMNCTDEQLSAAIDYMMQPSER